MKEEGLLLLIGGAGYIGTVLTEHFLASGRAVRCLDSLIYGHEFAPAPFRPLPNYEFHQGDLCDRNLVVHSLAGVSDVVILGGLVGDPITKKYPALSEQINLHGIATVLECAKHANLKKVVFVSTCSNYGLLDESELATEETALQPLSAYARAKVAIEQILASSVGDFGDAAVTTLRFATAFGLSKRMRFDLTVNEFTRALCRGEELVVFDENTWRPYCHVIDFFTAIDKVLKASEELTHGQVFNVGGDKNNFTKKKLVDEILKKIPSGKVRYQQNGVDPRNYRVSFKKIRDTIGFCPTKTVPDGISEICTALEAGEFQSQSNDPPNLYGNYYLCAK
jgi:nucleoside-diphosphate-sugar epimerase